MCGRKFSHEDLTWSEYREILEIIKPPPHTNFEPNYNICPTQKVPVCLTYKDDRRLEMLNWGLVPSSAKDRKFAANMINARAETIAKKPAFQPLLNKRRCIIMVSGFYEWQRQANSKTPYKVERPDGRPMLIAGLWTHNQKLSLNSYTIITTAAPDRFSAIHHRCPILLEQSQISIWLEGEWSEASKLVNTYQGPLQATRISNAVNSSRNNGPELLLPDLR